MMLTVDGYFEGPNHDISWHNVDEEFNNFAIAQLDETDTLVFGKRTYDLMAGFWPTKQGMEAEPETAERMNRLRKIVFSHSLTKAAWHNTEVHSTDVGEVMRKLKSQPGKDIAVFGSSNLCITLLKEKVLDEVRVIINPIALGNGTSLFQGLDHPYKFTLTKSRTFNSGNILHVYRVVT